MRPAAQRRGLVPEPRCTTLQSLKYKSRGTKTEPALSLCSTSMYLFSCSGKMFAKYKPKAGKDVVVVPRPDIVKWQLAAPVNPNPNSAPSTSSKCPAQLNGTNSDQPEICLNQSWKTFAIACIENDQPSPI